MIAVELRGVHMMGCAYLYMVHVRSFTTCKNCVMYVCFSHIITHTEQ